MDWISDDLKVCINSLEHNPVSSPKHYTTGSIQPIDYMRANFSSEELEGFLKGNLIKYIYRYQNKNGVEDLKKARQYLDWLIEANEKPAK